MTKARVTTVLFLLLLAAAPRAASQQADASLLYRLSLPDKNWALDLDLSAFDILAGSRARAGKKTSVEAKEPTPVIEKLSDDGTTYRFFALKTFGESGVPFGHLSIRLEPARANGTDDYFRAFALNELAQHKKLKGDVKTNVYKGIPVARFKTGFEFEEDGGYSGALGEFAGGLQHMTAYFVRDDVWVTLSLVSLAPGKYEEKLFNSLLDSVRFADTSAPSTSYDFYHKGRILYLRKDYVRAAEALAVALSLEQKQKGLDVASWRVLLANLAHSYGATGDHVRAKETLDHAAAADPKDPIFQLALARFHAGLGDFDLTIAHLEKAFRLNADRGDKPLPDPLRDPAFGAFSNDEKFRKAVKRMKK